MECPEAVADENVFPVDQVRGSHDVFLVYFNYKAWQAWICYFTSDIEKV